ncbi:hypothetical protein MTO96_003870 [Rhipicephalus appendiculatus]
MGAHLKDAGRFLRDRAADCRLRVANHDHSVWYSEADVEQPVYAPQASALVKDQQTKSKLHADGAEDGSKRGHKDPQMAKHVKGAGCRRKKIATDLQVIA